MVGVEPPAARARLSVKSYVERLRSEVTGLSSVEYPGNLPGPRRWLALVQGLLDTADEFLLSAHSPNSSSSPEELAGEATSLASLAYECLHLMRGAGPDDLPYPVVRPLQRWFDELKISNTTFFRSEAIANYELRRIDHTLFTDIPLRSASLVSAIDSIEWPLLRVTVPSKALGILPHFAIVAHEIGHALYDRVQWDQSVLQAEEEVVKSRVAKRLNSK
jgi:hypothetical protein